MRNETYNTLEKILSSYEIGKILKAVGNGNNVKNIQIETKKNRTNTATYLSILSSFGLINVKKLDPKDGRKTTYSINHEKLKSFYNSWCKSREPKSIIEQFYETALIDRRNYK